jgi:hypothetical protein
VWLRVPSLLCAVRLTQKWIEGEFWAQQFATRSLIAFAHVKGGPTSSRIEMSDALRKKGVAFKMAKHGALRRGLEDTPWKLAACVRRPGSPRSLSLPGRPDA